MKTLKDIVYKCGKKAKYGEKNKENAEGNMSIKIAKKTSRKRQEY